MEACFDLGNLTLEPCKEPDLLLVLGMVVHQGMELDLGYKEPEQHLVDEVLLELVGDMETDLE